MTAIGGKIVFAEDNISIVKIVTNKLSLDGYEVFHFPNGEGVLDSVLTNKPDLVILDITMPVKDGLTVLKEIRENQETANVPVLLLTANKDEQTVSKSLGLGVSDYITKPFSLIVFSSRVKKLIENRKV
jgi:DNA-binding response OmpR family regulator